ncbi:M28 family metallopeptidase [Aequorivita marisscotiae]|uniref:M28 family metallopeptidase n=1 Tax=Aequorivita marisscotiae TaxID=3040348 RepID=A0ABY8KR73_9FLAO|nr:M28 family metallopeptidase [Aequorivita sp. Ant34-E75]WGF91478.1 M28 family metallopeptidase [Aequorivita sp. Ant34-E75]
MKILFLAAISSLIFSCSTAQKSINTKEKSVQYANTITAQKLKDLLYVYASDEMEGRMTGSKGQKMAANFIRDFYKENGIAAAPGTEDYYQYIPASFFEGRRDPKETENVVAFIKGSEKPDEIIVISAHLDHVGVDNSGNVFNGADDDGSGTVAIMEIAQAFKQAVKDGYPPKRSILFLHVTGEEIGLYGSRYYTENPLFPLENTVCNLNIDMIGRIDPDKEEDPNYIYLIGSNKISQELQDVSSEVNEKYTQLELDYKYDDPNDPNRFYYRSDHYNFAKNNVPIIFYFNGVHEDYHKITDTPDKIEYDLLEKRTKLIFHTAWEIANRENRITID